MIFLIMDVLHFIYSTFIKETTHIIISITHQSTTFSYLFSNPVRELDSTAQFPQLVFPPYAARSGFVEGQLYLMASTTVSRQRKQLFLA